MGVRECPQCDPLNHLGPAGARVLLQMLETDPATGEYVKTYAYELSRKANVTYPTAWLLLRALSEANYVQEADDGPSFASKRRRPRYYRLTPEGAERAKEAVLRVLSKMDSKVRQKRRARKLAAQPG